MKTFDKAPKKTGHWAIFFGVFVLFALMQMSNVAERWNYVFYDFFQSVTKFSASNDIAIINIDDASLKEIGQWPWGRNIHADLLRRLNKITPQSVTFDLLFVDKDSRSENGDLLFSQEIQRNGKVVLPVLHLKNDNSKQGVIVQYPIPILKNQASQLAHVDAEIDSDGLVRRAYLKAGLEGGYFSSLGLAAVEVAKNARLQDLPGLQIDYSDAKGLFPINTWERNNQILLSFADEETAFSTYSYFDVLSDDAVLKKLDGKIIFIGVSASGLSTNMPIANSGTHKQVSSVFYHASIANAMLMNNSIITPPQFLIIAVGAILLFMLALFYSVSWSSIDLLVVSLFVGVSLVSSFILFNVFYFWFPPVEIITALLISYPLNSWFQLKQMTKQLTKEKEQAEVTLNSIEDGVITLDSDDHILYMNPVAESLTGVSLEQGLHQPLSSVFVVLDQKTNKQVMHHLLKYLTSDAGTFPHEHYILKNAKGHEYTIRVAVGKIQHASVVDDGAVLAFSDITQTVNLLDHMSHQAMHDTLTDLPNRAFLMESLIHALAVADRNQYQVALLFLDIDKFKNINDGFGHEAGDQVLAKIAEKLKASVREEDMVARLGGDEFVVVLDQVASAASAALVAQKILEKLSSPIRLFDQDFLVTCSIGVSLFPRDAKNAETLLKNADIAMYSAKDGGRNSFQYFSKEMNEIVQGRLKLEKELRLAFESNHLALYYQPQVNARTNELIGVEALLRWNHSKLGFVSPDRFIPLAEDTGLILPIGEWVLRKACQQIKKWESLIDDDFSLAVNLSPRQFLGQDMLAVLTKVLTSEGVDAKHLKLEITEGLFISGNNIDTTLEQYRKMGGTVSIDDFGTGYSSLSYLNRIPVDQIKIDRHFIREIVSNGRGRCLTKAIISMAHDMGLDVIAEGVENKEQLDILKNLNCFHIQGFYFSHAVEADKITKLLKAKQPFGETC